MRTLLLRAGSEEATHAPEFRYLASWVELQARRALGELRIVEGPFPRLSSLREAEERVLWLGNERLLVTARTLGRLSAALDDGAPAASPRSVAEVLAHQGDPPALYTLRGFERLEERLLADRGDRPVSETCSGAPGLPPVTLLSRSAIATLAARSPDETRAPELALVRTGLYHEFIDYYGVVRSDVLPHIPRRARKILEVGCGRGVTGELLRRERGATVTGVELNPVVARRAAERLDRVVQGDIEDPSLDAEIVRDGRYDLVLALELFEHLAYPEGFLERAARWLAPGGMLLLSTPNVGHHAVVEDLLAGRWDYLPIGLLCYTHLRFFTRRTLEDWLARLGFGDFELIPQLTEGSPCLEALSQGMEVDAESLRTRGFYVLVRPS